MNRRIAVVVVVLLVLVAAVIAQVAFAGGNRAGDVPNGEKLAGPWYSPQERQALAVYANASFARKQSILAGSETQRHTAAAAGATDLVDAGDLHEGIGQSDTKQLQHGSIYTASAFAVGVKIRPPDALWAGIQHESGHYRFVQLSHLHVAGTSPLTGVGYITLESATVATPSVARTLANLRATPNLHVGEVKSVRVAGLAGKSFDAVITGADVPKYCETHVCGKGVSLEPFMTNHHCGFCTNTMHQETQDVKYAAKGQLFRIIVLNARRKVVVIYVESIYPDQKKFPPAKLFPTFLPYAQKLLAGISFS